MTNLISCYLPSTKDVIQIADHIKHKASEKGIDKLSDEYLNIFYKKQYVLSSSTKQTIHDIEIIFGKNEIRKIMKQTIHDLYNLSNSYFIKETKHKSEPIIYSAEASDVVETLEIVTLVTLIITVVALVLEFIQTCIAIESRNKSEEPPKEKCWEEEVYTEIEFEVEVEVECTEYYDGARQLIGFDCTEPDPYIDLSEMGSEDVDF